MKDDYHHTLVCERGRETLGQGPIQGWVSNRGIFGVNEANATHLKRPRRGLLSGVQSFRLSAVSEESLNTKVTQA